MRPIVDHNITYRDLIGMFGSTYEMPPEAAFERGDEVEYRCPYHSVCPAHANCFAVSSPEPLYERDIINIKCRLCGNRKIPVYAGLSANYIK